jgi:RES domain-containing protein
VVSAALVSAIDQLDRVAFAGEAFRHVGPQYNPLSGAGARTQGGRWNPPQSFATLYLGGDRETVIAEFNRAVTRSRRAPADFLPRRFYRYEIQLSALLDLRVGENRNAVNLSDEALSADDLRPCQAVGEAAHHVGREGIIAPSATGPGTVVAVFFDRLEADSFVHDLDFEVWEALPDS